MDRPTTAASNRWIARLDASILILIVALGLFSLAVWSNPTFPGLEDARALDVTINVAAVLAGAAVEIQAWTRWRDTGASVAMFVALPAGAAHPLHQPALNVFRRVAAGELGLVVTPIVIAELVYVTRDVVGWSRALIVERLGLLLDADGLVVTEASVTRRALRLYGQRSQLDFADAYLAAVALEISPAAVASFDTDFDAVRGLPRISA